MGITRISTTSITIIPNGIRCQLVLGGKTRKAVDGKNAMKVSGLSYVVLLVLFLACSTSAWTLNSAPSLRRNSLVTPPKFSVSSSWKSRVRPQGVLYSSSLAETEEKTLPSQSQPAPISPDLTSGNLVEAFLNVKNDNTELKQKFINGALLIACFGYATYTIFNIDHGMTRGWTQSVSK